MNSWNLEIKCKHGDDNKTCRIKCKDCDCRLECKNSKHDSIGYKYLCCNKNDQKTFHENLKQRIHVNFLTKISVSLVCCC